MGMDPGMMIQMDPMMMGMDGYGTWITMMQMGMEMGMNMILEEMNYNESAWDSGMMGMDPGMMDGPRHDGHGPGMMGMDLGMIYNGVYYGPEEGIWLWKA